MTFIHATEVSFLGEVARSWHYTVSYTGIAMTTGSSDSYYLNSQSHME